MKNDFLRGSIWGFSKGWCSQTKIKFREKLPNSQKFRGPTQSGRSQGNQRWIIRFVKNQLHILMQSQTRKNCLHWYKSKDHTVANELFRRVSTLLKGLIRQQKKLWKSPKSQVSTAMEKFCYKRISNYIKTCSTTPNTGKFARVKGWAKKHKCSIACDHTTGRLIKTRSNKISWELAKFAKV